MVTSQQNLLQGNIFPAVICPFNHSLRVHKSNRSASLTFWSFSFLLPFGVQIHRFYKYADRFCIMAWLFTTMVWTLDLKHEKSQSPLIQPTVTATVDAMSTKCETNYFCLINVSPLFSYPSPIHPLTKHTIILSWQLQLSCRSQKSRQYHQPTAQINWN